MLLFAALAHAEETAEETAEDPPPATTIDTSEAQELKPLKPGELQQFQPKRHLLPQQPRGQTDFTAYTLEWGEVEVGTDLTVGVLPGVQLGTVVLLDVFQVWNASGKVNAIRIGPWDLAGNVNFYTFQQPNIQSTFVSFGGTTSFILVPAWSIHAGGYYSMFDAKGQVPGEFVGGILSAFTGSTIEDADDLELGLDARAFTALVATDVRFNRVHGLVLQGRAMLWRGISFEAGLSSGDEAIIERGEEGWVPISENYVASLSYQLSTRNVDLRLGVGVPFLNPAWILQAVDFSFRFGGKTRVAERKMKKTYQQNVKDSKK